MQKLVLLCGIISGMISLLDYFVSKEKLAEFEEKKIKPKIEGAIDWLLNNSYGWFTFGCLGIDGALTLYLCVKYDSWLKFSDAHPNVGAFIVIGVAVPLFIVLLYLLVKILRFIIWTPKGIIRGIFAPLSVISLASSIYSMFQ